MKVSHAQDNVRGAQGLGEHSKYQIAMNGHAFKLLSSGLYSDKIRAVLREIGCNARDAHIEAGHPARPFRVKLPNKLEGQFYIQDWGPGLSHDDVMRLYSTYFASTKQTSNDFTGAFGLGSKSPFAYTDSYTVVSAHGGKKRTYTLYLDNTGIPTTALMTEEDADPDWPTGVRVGFAVKPADYNAFAEKAQEVFQWFDPLPEVKGAAGVRSADLKERSADFWVRRNPVNPAEVLVVQGAVAYPLDLAQIGAYEADAEKRTNDLLHFVHSTGGLVLPVPIGTVTPTPSREQLQYDPESIKALQGVVRKAMRSLGLEVVRVLEEVEKGGWRELCTAKDKVEAVLSGKLKWGFGGFGVALGLDKKRAELFAKYIDRESVDIPLPQKPKCAIRLAQTYYGRLKVHTGLHSSGNKYSGSDVEYAVDYKGSKKEMQILADTVVAWGKDKHVLHRLKGALRDGLHKQVLAVGADKDHRPSAAEMLEEAERVARELGGVPVVEMSTLPVPADAKIGSGKKRRPKNFVPTLNKKFEVTAVNIDGKEYTVALGDFKPRLMMCFREQNTWGNTRQFIREYEKSVDDDPRWLYNTWMDLWGKFRVLANVLKVPDTPEQYAEVSASDIRQNFMVEGGFTSARKAMQEYMKRADVRKALKAKLKTWSPAAPDWVSHGGGWASYLSHYMLKDDGMTAALRPLLEKARLVDQLDAAVKEAKRKRGGKAPDYLEAYEELCRELIPGESIDKGMVVTMEDMDNSFSTRFPLLGVVSAHDVLGSYSDTPKLCCELLELLLSKEVKS